MRCLACDFGGSSVKFALVDDEANITEHGKLPAPLYSVEQFQDTVEYIYNQYKNEINGISISLPGYIDPDKGYLFESGVYRPLYNKAIPELLKGCPVHVVVENDGKCGALAEAWNGALKDVNDGAVIILGSGIAGGIIKDKHVHWGKGFAAGELSYLLTSRDSHTYKDTAVMNIGMLGITYKMCKYKNLDFSVQDSSDMMVYFDHLFADSFPKLNGEPKKIKADGVQLFSWLKEGDPDAERIYKDFIDALAMLIFNTQIVFGPERIVIGGGLSRQKMIYRDLEEELNRYYSGCFLSEQLQSEVVQSVYLDECNLIGAAYNYFTRFGSLCG